MLARTAPPPQCEVQPDRQVYRGIERSAPLRDGRNLRDGFSELQQVQAHTDDQQQHRSDGDRPLSPG